MRSFFSQLKAAGTNLLGVRALAFLCTVSLSLAASSPGDTTEISDSTRVLTSGEGETISEGADLEVLTLSLDRDRRIIATPDMPFEDTAILPSSLMVRMGNRLLVEGREYRFDSVKGILYLLDASLIGRLLDVHYKVLRVELPPLFQERERSQLPWYDPGEDSLSFPQQPALPTRSRTYGNGLRTRGSFLRGVRVGSGGSMTMESGLQLTVDGQIGPDVKVEAYLSDRNSPIQPEGNSQSLEEIDRIHLLVQSPSWRVLMGDFDLNMKQGRYLQYRRTVDGLQGGYQTDQHRALAHFALARGRFRTMEFLGQQGVQGPWQLLSESGSRQIVVLAGSEQVYLDGQLLTRGDEQDYVMDYGLGQLRFNARHPIRADHRIVVEYQYSERLYERSLYGADLAFQGPAGFQLRIAAAGERDDASNPLSQFLGEEDRQRLAEAGDQIEAAWGSGVREVEPGQGHYRLVDSQAGRWGEFVFSEIIPDGEDSLYIYDLRFSDVSFDSRASFPGDYSRHFTSRGLAWFQFEGEGLGAWAPLLPLSAPKSHEMVDADLRWQKGWWTLAFETALSREDHNLYSSKDDDDNLGLAFDGSVQLKPPRFPFFERSWQPRFSLSYGQEQSKFSLIQPDREVEFSRVNGFTRAGGLKRLYTTLSMTADSNFARLDVSRFERDTLDSRILAPRWKWRPGLGIWTTGDMVWRRLSDVSSYRHRFLEVGYDWPKWTLSTFGEGETRHQAGLADSLASANRSRLVQGTLISRPTEGLRLEHTQAHRLLQEQANGSDWFSQSLLRTWEQRVFFDGSLRGRMEWSYSRLEPYLGDSTTTRHHVANIQITKSNPEWQASFAYRAHSSLERERLTQYIEVDSLTGTHSRDPFHPDIFVPDADGNFIAMSMETGHDLQSALVETESSLRWHPEGAWRGQHTLRIKGSSTRKDPLALYLLSPQALFDDSVRFVNVKTRHDLEYTTPAKVAWRLRLEASKRLDRLQFLLTSEHESGRLALRRQERFGEFRLMVEAAVDQDIREYPDRGEANHRILSRSLDVDLNWSMSRMWTLNFGTLTEDGRDAMQFVDARRLEIDSRLQWRGKRGQVSVEASWQQAWANQDTIPYELIGGARVGRTLRASLDGGLRFGQRTRLGFNWQVDALPDRKARQSAGVQVQSFF